MSNYIWALITSLPLSGIVLACVYYLAPKFIDRAFRVSADKTIETFKAALRAESDRVQHLFGLELKKMSIVYEYQRNSFSNVILAMHEAIAAIDFDWHQEVFQPISKAVPEKFDRVTITESLFLDDESEHAVHLFLEILWRCAATPMDPDVESEELRGHRDELLFLSGQIREYFRTRVGISTAKPLIEVAILGACILVKQYSQKSGWHSDSELTAMDLMSEARKDSTRLIGALQTLASSFQEKRFYLERQQETERYIRILTNSGVDTA